MNFTIIVIILWAIGSGIMLRNKIHTEDEIMSKHSRFKACNAFIKAQQRTDHNIAYTNKQTMQYSKRIKEKQARKYAKQIYTKQYYQRIYNKRTI